MQLENYCSAKQQENIVQDLQKGDRLMADVMYKYCVNTIHDLNPNLIQAHALEVKGATTGVTQAEETKQESLEKEGKRQVNGLDIELLQTIKNKQKPDGLCKIDFDQNGNPYVPDTKIYCKDDVEKKDGK